MKLKTSELTGAALDWAVSMLVENNRRFPIWIDGKPQSYAAYSTDWAQGGPIIERQEIELVPKGVHWDAYADEDFHVPYSGPTALIAAMRCFVASRLGDNIDVPEELCK